MKKYKFNKAADEYLNDTYIFHKANTLTKKIKTMEKLIGGQFGYSSNNKHQILGSLEYEFLEVRNLIKVTYC